MKVSFRDGDVTQKPVSFTQEEMKAYKSKKYPVYKSFLLLVLLFTIAMAGTYLYRKNILYTYGIVSADEVQAKAGNYDEIESVLVEKGQLVSQGEVLFTQLSRKGKALIARAEQKIQAKSAEYKRLLDLINGQENAENDSLKSEIEILRLKQQGTASERARSLAQARAKLNRLKRLTEVKNKRYAAIKKLFDLDAATRLQVEEARTVKQTVADEYNLAKKIVNQLLREINLAKSEASQQIAKLKTAMLRNKRQRKEDAEALAAEIEIQKAELERLKKQYASGTYKAPFDAIITDVLVSNGTTVTKDEPILSMVSIKDLWVDVYVEADEAHLLTKDKHILIYPEGDHQPIKGTLSSTGKVQLEIPYLLRDKFAKVHSAVYFHVKYENTGQLAYGNVVRVVVN